MGITGINVIARLSKSFSKAAACNKATNAISHSAPKDTIIRSLSNAEDTGRIIKNIGDDGINCLNIVYSELTHYSPKIRTQFADFIRVLEQRNGGSAPPERIQSLFNRILKNPNYQSETELSQYLIDLKALAQKKSPGGEYLLNGQTVFHLADFKSNNIEFTNSKLNNIKIGSITLLDIMYPVGCIFTTIDQKFRPATTFGGTWVNIAEEKGPDGKGSAPNGHRFLVAMNQSMTPAIGGSQYITTANMPRHTHSVSIKCDNADVKHKHPIKSEFDNYDYNTVAHDANFNKFIDELLKSNINSIPLDTSAKYYNWNKRYYRTTYTEDTSINHNHEVTGSIGQTGNNNQYWPLFYRVYYWKRIA